MIKETYERLYMDVTQFDAEDIITTSGEGPDPGHDINHSTNFKLGRFEQGLGIPLGF